MQLVPFCSTVATYVTPSKPNYIYEILAVITWVSCTCHCTIF